MIKISKHSGIYSLRVTQELEVSMEEAWDFFSSPSNLEKITPKEMGFKITGEKPVKMYEGQIISYRVGILPGIRSNWITEISHVDYHKMFVDEQRFGPYSMWHHEHHFEEKNGKILMTDKVFYKVPLGIIGRLFHPLIVGPKLKSIFSHREEIINEYFKNK